MLRRFKLEPGSELWGRANDNDSCRSSTYLHEWRTTEGIQKHDTRYANNKRLCSTCIIFYCINIYDEDRVPAWTILCWNASTLALSFVLRASRRRLTSIYSPSVLKISMYHHKELHTKAAIIPACERFVFDICTGVYHIEARCQLNKKCILEIIIIFFLCFFPLHKIQVDKTFVTFSIVSLLFIYYFFFSCNIPLRICLLTSK